MSNCKAIVAGTHNNAETYGKLDDFGTLEPGKRAPRALAPTGSG